MDNSPQNSEAPQGPQGKRRLGRLHLRHVTFAHDWHAFLPLMARIVVIRAESMYALDAIEYLALSDDFDEIDPTETIPLYQPKYVQVETEDGQKHDTFIFGREEQ